MIQGRFRFWQYPNGVEVEIPVDSPAKRPPTRVEDVPPEWVRKPAEPPASR